MCLGLALVPCITRAFTPFTLTAPYSAADEETEAQISEPGEWWNRGGSETGEATAEGATICAPGYWSIRLPWQEGHGLQLARCRHPWYEGKPECVCIQLSCKRGVSGALLNLSGCKLYGWVPAHTGEPLRGYIHRQEG